jgi:hypothetical protein
MGSRTIDDDDGGGDDILIMMKVEYSVKNMSFFISMHLPLSIYLNHPQKAYIKGHCCRRGHAATREPVERVHWTQQHNSNRT